MRRELGRQNSANHNRSRLGACIAALWLGILACHSAWAQPAPGDTDAPAAADASANNEEPPADSLPPPAMPSPPQGPGGDLQGAEGQGTDDQGADDQGADDQGPAQRQPPPLQPPAPHDPRIGRAGRPPLTQEEMRTLMRGPISPVAWVGGGVLGSWIGFGTGHAVQGRFLDSGVIFAGGELLSLVVASVAFERGSSSSFSCDEFGCREELVNRDTWKGIGAGSVLLFAALRVWEIVDVWYGPSRVNNYYEHLRQRHSQPGWSMSVLPTPGGGGTFAASMHF